MTCFPNNLFSDVCSGLLPQIEQIERIEQQSDIVEELRALLTSVRRSYWQNRIDGGCARALLALAGIDAKTGQGAEKIFGGRKLDPTAIPWKKYTNSIKTIREAKKILAEREARRSARRRGGEYPNNREKYRQAKKQYAVAMGEKYHRDHQDHPLYRSQYASVVYGEGGERCVSWDEKPKKYSKYPTKWRNAGARFVGRYVVIEDYLGREVSKKLITKKARQKIMRNVLNIDK